MTGLPLALPNGLTHVPDASFHEFAQRLKALYPNPFVLQIGAMDGVRFDLLYPHLIKGGWRALLVEPVPDMFALLQKNYAAQPELMLVNCAIADYNGLLDLHRIDPAAIATGLIVEEALGVTSAFPERGVLGGINLREDYKEIVKKYRQILTVPCLTLTKLLEDYRIDAIDFVVIDCEGADWLIARQLDLKRYRPLGLCLEFTSLAGSELQECCAHFSAHDYQLALCREDNQNLLFLKANP